MRDLLNQYKVKALKIYDNVKEIKDSFPDYSFFESIVSDKVGEISFLVGKKKGEVADVVLYHSEEFKGWFEAESERLKDGLYSLREGIRVSD
jgi:hypothetical protein